MRPLFSCVTVPESLQRKTFWWAWLLLCSLFTSGAWAQRYSTARVRETADSVLLQRLGPTLYAQTRYDATTYYRYRSWLGQEKFRTLTARRKTKGHLLAVDVRYHARIYPTGCPAMDTITGMASVTLDGQLHLLEAPYVAFIPDFVWRQEPCALISREQVVAIGRGAPLQPGLESPTTLLAYNPTTKAFTWTVYNYLTRRFDYGNQPTGNVEVVEIDASTGQILQHETRWYGPVR